jgi:hypothetical protein
LLLQLNGAAVLAQEAVSIAEVGQDGPFPQSVPHLAREGEALFEEFNCATVFAQRDVGGAEVSQRGPFPLAVAYLSRGSQVSLVEVNCAAVLPERAIGEAEISQRGGYPPEVAYFARDYKILLVAFNRAAVFPQEIICDAEVASMHTFSRAVVQSLGGGNGRFVPLDLISRMLANPKQEGAVARISIAKPCRFFILLGPLRRALLPDLDVQPIQVEKIQPSRHAFAPLGVQVIGLAKYIEVMPGVTSDDFSSAGDRLSS